MLSLGRCTDNIDLVKSLRRVSLSLSNLQANRFTVQHSLNILCKCQASGVRRLNTTSRLPEQNLLSQRRLVPH